MLAATLKLELKSKQNLNMLKETSTRAKQHFCPSQNAVGCCCNEAGATTIVLRTSLGPCSAQASLCTQTRSRTKVFNAETFYYTEEVFRTHTHMRSPTEALPQKLLDTEVFSQRSLATNQLCDVV